MFKNGKVFPGTLMQFKITFLDENGDAADPDTVLFKTRAPRGTETTYTYGTDSEVTKSSTGNYVAEFAPDEHGRWYIRWQTDATSGVAKEESFIVMTSKFSPYDDDAWPDYR